MFSLWFQFLAASLLIILAARILSINADKLAELKNWGRAWIGLVLLATITSLPELSTTTSAVLILKGEGASSLAVANVLGSNVFNLFILFFVDILLGTRIVWESVQENHDISLLAGVVFTMLICLNIWLLFPWAIGGVGLVCWFIFIAYWPLMWYLGRVEHPTTANIAPADSSIGRVVAIIVLSAVVVVISGIWLVGLSDQLAEATGWGHSFVGALFIALVTSLPELVVCWTSVRLASVDMAMGNILGSNIFNLMILFIADLGYRSGPILVHISPSLLVPACFGLLMMLITFFSLKFPRQVSYLGVSIGSACLLVAYLTANYWLFVLSRGN